MPAAMLKDPSKFLLAVCIEAMTDEERARLTAWMVSRYPVLNVEQLMGHAAGLVACGEWAPAPPTEENRPQGKLLDHALRVAQELESQ